MNHIVIFVGGPEGHSRSEWPATPRPQIRKRVMHMDHPAFFRADPDEARRMAVGVHERVYNVYPLTVLDEPRNVPRLWLACYLRDEKR